MVHNNGTTDTSFVNVPTTLLIVVFCIPQFSYVVVTFVVCNMSVCDTLLICSVYSCEGVTIASTLCCLGKELHKCRLDDLASFNGNGEN